MGRYSGVGPLRAFRPKGRLNPYHDCDFENSETKMVVWLDLRG